jgi:hypothetical protein
MVSIRKWIGKVHIGSEPGDGASRGLRDQDSRCLAPPEQPNFDNREEEISAPFVLIIRTLIS